MTAVDDEGFPVGSASRDRRLAHPGKDEESGEIVREKVVALRRLPDQKLLPDHPSCSCSRDPPFTLLKDHRRMGRFRIQDVVQGHGDLTFQRGRLPDQKPLLDHPSCSRDPPFPLLKDHRRMGRFRIQDVVQGHGDLTFQRGSMLYRREVLDLPNPKFETCWYLEGGVTVRRVTNYSKVVLPDVARGRKPTFRVPKESLPPDQSEDKKKRPETICINIWEEFLYGESVLNRCSKAGGQPIKGVNDTLYRFLGRYMSTSVIDALRYTLFFILFFASCCVYNDYCELGFYILLASHLKIHEGAYENKLNVEFTGSPFQGPAYVFIRNWCQHCIQKDVQIITSRLMKKMKIDIINRKNR